ncbi:uncharacterized protein EHS24_005272 [Apiotrichum porosum]|uniref:Uncharacterized protein n=1 Tax=Apiotrichum porosum TaxID=105984 RepID=A0A427XD73_9TREE|nr:uncharacterized protein EHS24_005272 [Apiotrichum porosum]RSH76870.1 hypothetical protein EHS24_005272 [Apiotrichum porosum]
MGTLDAPRVPSASASTHQPQQQSWLSRHLSRRSSYNDADVERLVAAGYTTKAARAALSQAVSRAGQPVDIKLALEIAQHDSHEDVGHTGCPECARNRARVAEQHRQREKKGLAASRKIIESPKEQAMRDEALAERRGPPSNPQQEWERAWDKRASELATARRPPVAMYGA